MTAPQDITPTQAWLMATRPKTLPAAVAPVVVGTAVALHDGVFRFLPALFALLGAMLLQIGVNLANDYFDYHSGVDAGERKGPQRVTQSGLISPERVRLGMIITFGLSALVGVYLIIVGGWPVLVIGLASILSALAYSGGPFPLASNGLGDLFVFIFFGLVAVAGTYYVQALTVTSLVFWSAVPPGLLITAILVINNLRDIESDSKAGKKTLAVILGGNGAKAEYYLLIVVSYLVPIILWLAGQYDTWVLLTLLTIPLAVPLFQAINTPEDGKLMNKTLAGTARLALVFSILFSIGVNL